MATPNTDGTAIWITRKSGMPPIMPTAPVTLVEIPILISLGLLFGPGLGVINHSFAEYMIQDFAGFDVGILGLVVILYYESHNINLGIY